jgi:hypothetical protein
LRIENCKISKVETNPQELKDGDARVTTIAHIVGSLTKDLAKIICGKDGAAALFGKDSFLRSGPVGREPGVSQVSFYGHRKDEPELVLPSCDVNKITVNGATEKIAFHICCERAGDLLYNEHIANPVWSGAVEIDALQGELFGEAEASE